MQPTYRRMRDTNWCLINGDGYIASSRKGTTLAMNRSATLIWDWLADGHTVCEMEEALRRLYEDQTFSREDITRFITDLDAHGLVASDAEGNGKVHIDVARHSGGDYARPALEPIGEPQTFAFA